MLFGWFRIRQSEFEANMKEMMSRLRLNYEFKYFNTKVEIKLPEGVGVRVHFKAGWIFVTKYSIHGYTEMEKTLEHQQVKFSENTFKEVEWWIKKWNMELKLGR
jgi:hypothetical protein